MNVLYVQPYLAGYRVPLYDALEKLLAERGSTLTVAAGQPSGVQARRGDTAGGAWLTTVPSHVVRTPAGEFKYRRRLAPLMARADLCVMELDVGNLNAWAAVAARSRRPRMILWGHGKCYTTAANPVTERLKRRLALRADHVMTYTASGRDHLVRQGVPSSRVTSVGNSTDTAALRACYEARLRRPLTRSETFGIDVSGRTVAMYVGGLDTDKRVPFLAAAVRAAAERDPRFLLLVAGSGSDEALLESPHVLRIPYADHAALADLGAVSSAVWMPGRVGLVAVDAMALGRPVLTTPFPHHAPEFEFLTPGVGVHVLPDSPAAFAERALAVMRTRPRYTARCLPSIARVAEAMTGVLDTVADREAMIACR